MEALITAKTSGLCFNKDDFMVKDFSVDKFVSNYRKYVSLETLLEDLGVYHKILCSAMIELINMDYADFVNLSSNLVGLDKSIKTLSMPLEKLKAEVEDMKASLNETLDIAKTKFIDYSSAYKMKVLSHHALCVLEGLEKIEILNAMIHASDTISDPSDILERMALDFNIVEFHMSKISSLKGFESKKMAIKEIADSLTHYLEELFLRSLSTNDNHNLNKVLRIYAVIDKTEELENFFAETVVRPYMEVHITEEAILKLGLSFVYDKILSFITTSSAILDATRGTKKSVEIVPGYDFLVNAVLPEAVRCFNLIAPVHVFAHGDPELFHINYSATVKFLDRFEHYCQVQKSVLRLRAHESYQQFLNKWNLDIYFQIRFQEIAGKFENSLIDGFIFSKSLNEEKKSNKYLLNASISATECIKLCWSDKIFLKPLGYSFFRLNLQIISRFYNSACSHLKCENAEKGKSLNPLGAASVIRDVEIMITELTKFFENRICLKIDKNVAEVAFKESIKLLEDIIPLASSLMIKSLTKQSCAPLKSISDIPRLYRKTNREVPSKPSSYVSSVFKSLTDFIAETESILPAKSKKFCLLEVINGIIVECNIMVKDVLTAIKKMEDSLKILKRAREKNLTTSGSMSDDDKIRRQLIIDLTAIEEKARSLGLDIDSLKSFKELKVLMNSTEKTLPKNYL